MARTLWWLLVALSVPLGAWAADHLGLFWAQPVLARRAPAMPTDPDLDRAVNFGSPDSTPVPSRAADLGEHNRGLGILSGEVRKRLLLFTFDDGPDADTTPELLERLDRAGIRALFFLTGERMGGRGTREAEQRKLAQLIAEKGHVIGNHTYHHYQLVVLNNTQINQEIEGVENIFLHLFGKRSWVIRPPGGARSARLDRLIDEQGYTQVLWNLGSGDFLVKSAEDVYQTWKRVFHRREKEDGSKGGIILLHDTHPWSVKGFQLIYDDIMARNCELLLKDEELYDIVDQPFYLSETWLAQPDHQRILEGRQERVRDETQARCF